MPTVTFGRSIKKYAQTTPSADGVSSFLFFNFCFFEIFPILAFSFNIQSLFYYVANIVITDVRMLPRKTKKKIKTTLLLGTIYSRIVLAQLRLSFFLQFMMVWIIIH
jgi:hypothetical protein